MNFFGHAALAARHLRASEAALGCDVVEASAGAMLPDFSGMLRLEKPRRVGAAFARGIAFHHRTDRAFHALAAFHDSSRAAVAWLVDRGLGRGPARAVAHIGIELLLDEVLAHEEEHRAAYRRALAWPWHQSLEFIQPESGKKLAELCARLLQHAEEFAPPAPSVLAARLCRILDARPRLAPGESGRPVIERWIAHTRPLLHCAAPALLSALSSQLEEAPVGANERFG
jgi:hypothetical protein